MRLRNHLVATRLVLAWSVSLAGLVYQLASLSEQYFEYGTVTQLSLFYPDRVFPPKVAMCTWLLFIDHKRIPNLDDLVFFYRTSPKKAYGNVEVTTKGESFPKLSRSEINDYLKTNFTFARYYKRHEMCFTISINDSDPHETFFKTTSTAYPRLFAIKFEGDHFKEVDYNDFYLRPHNKNFYGPATSYAHHDRINDKAARNGTSYPWVTLSYSTYSGKLMEYPYDTQCFDYSKRNFESQDHCFNECVLKNWNLCCHGTPFNVLVLKITEPYIDVDSQYNSQLNEIDKNCKHICRFPDCTLEHHFPKVLFYQERDSMGIELYLSMQPQIETIFRERISVVDFVTLVLSCISFWLGISPLGLLSGLGGAEKKKKIKERGNRLSSLRARLEHVEAKLEAICHESS